MRASSGLALVALMDTAVFAVPNQVPMVNIKPVKQAMLSDLKESTLLPTGCFCAGADEKSAANRYSALLSAIWYANDPSFVRTLPPPPRCSPDVKVALFRCIIQQQSRYSS
ncbi:uncharacterized protein F4822DRAFT_434200 [Hypoxylon trugodes]|uniref:uncharacterized protein n=1 Tax=Hypoxylon trugodes TaxID=326681 RepID=UPI002196391D|nr:uncharacterized protein F4822DRAFT_434200 [Hypoxylon trugodes]KAI1384262.1 hypothetical protein F4822DRAFT_434200 [Hypoxylon trugodes]